LLCSDCLNGYILSSTKQCLKCPDNCYKCKVNSNEQTECINCDIGFALKDGICIECSTIQEIGGSGCDRCRYNYNSARYECINCINNNNYAFIQNTYKCLLNSISTYKNIKGCLRANFNEEKNIYECITCKPEFIPILNDKSCKLPNEANLKEYCKEANNIGTEQNPKYSCLQCKSLKDIIITKVIDFREINDCYKSENELIRCLTGIKYENNTIQCTKRYSNCVLMCRNNEKYVSIEYYYELDIEYDNNIYKLDINDLMNSKIKYTDSQDLMSIIDKGYLCLSNSGKGGKFSPKNLRKCKKAKYITSNDTYICIDCLDNYSLDNETNLCNQSIQVKMNIHPGISGCQVKNIGTYNNPNILA
jgi:hypothetical protein